jgi:hypothetical protein
VFKAAASGALLRIGRPESYFSFIYIADLVDGLILTAERRQAAGKAYFLANRGPVSWTEFGATAALTMVKKIRTFTLPVWVAYLGGCLADLISRMTGRPGPHRFRFLGSQSYRVAGAVQQPVAGRSAGNRLRGFRTRRSTGGRPPLDQKALSGVPVLCFFDRIGVLAILGRILYGACAPRSQGPGRRRHSADGTARVSERFAATSAEFTATELIAA